MIKPSSVIKTPWGSAIEPNIMLLDPESNGISWTSSTPASKRMLWGQTWTIYLFKPKFPAYTVGLCKLKPELSTSLISSPVFKTYDDIKKKLWENSNSVQKKSHYYNDAWISNWNQSTDGIFPSIDIVTSPHFQSKLKIYK